jgi:hypothetical protein
MNVTGAVVAPSIAALLCWFGVAAGAPADAPPTRQAAATDTGAQQSPDAEKATREFERKLRAALGEEPQVVAVPRQRPVIPTAYALGRKGSVGRFGYLFSRYQGRKLDVLDHGGDYGVSDRVDLGYWLRGLRARGRDRRNKLDTDSWGVHVKYALRKDVRSALALSLEFRESSGVVKRTSPTDSFHLDARVQGWSGGVHWSRSISDKLTFHALGLLAQTRDDRSDLAMTTVGIGGGLDYRLGGRTTLEGNAVYYHDEGDVPTGNEATVSGFFVYEPTTGLFLSAGAVLDVNGTPIAGLPLSDAAALRVAIDKPVVRQYANDTIGYAVLQAAYRRKW